MISRRLVYGYHLGNSTMSHRLCGSLLLLLRFLKNNLLDKVEKYLMINNAEHSNGTNGIIDSTLPRPSLRTSLLYEYFSESERSHLNPFIAINGKNVTEVDFHVNASFDYIKETGFWDDGEKIDEEWWFKNTENDNETIFPTNDQVIIGRVQYKSEIILIIS